MPFPSEHIKTLPVEWRFFNPQNEKKQPPLTEATILDRLLDAQELLRLPPSILNVLLEIVAPDTGLDAGDPPRELGIPTDALPGTDRKVEVMAERLAAGFALEHPLDATWDSEDEAHTEQVGELLRNGSIKRTKCKVAKRDGTSIVIPHDPAEAADTLRRHFGLVEMRELAGLLWEGIGYQSRKSVPPAEGFLVAGKIEPAMKKRGRKRGRKRRDSPDQLPLFVEDILASPEVAA